MVNETALVDAIETRSLMLKLSNVIMGEMERHDDHALNASVVMEALASLVAVSILTANDMSKDDIVQTLYEGLFERVADHVMAMQKLSKEEADARPSML